MKKAADIIKENLKAVDALLEIVDARIPKASRNTVLDALVPAEKERILVLNKKDLADPDETERWIAAFRTSGLKAVAADSSRGEGAAELMRLFTSLRNEKNEARGLNRDYRLMVAGIPNVGKSSLINRLTGTAGAKTGSRPGVTRGKQWLNLGGGIMLLDTPGILKPKLDDALTGQNLAFCGSIRDEALDIPTLGMDLIARLSGLCPDLLTARYKLEGIPESSLETMEEIARKRGFILSGGRIDYERCARTVLEEFRSGIIGRITLERANREQLNTLTE